MSADEYVPSEEDVREAYALEGARDTIGDLDYGEVPGGRAAFDRFLARVRRDAAREALAAAEQRIRDLTQEARDERGAARDQMEQVRIRDARIRHLEDTGRVLVKGALSAEAERDSARGYISELETAVRSRNDVIKHRDARIKAVRELLDNVDDTVVTEVDGVHVPVYLVRHALEG